MSVLGRLPVLGWLTLSQQEQRHKPQEQRRKPPQGKTHVRGGEKTLLPEVKGLVVSCSFHSRTLFAGGFAGRNGLAKQADYAGRRDFAGCSC